MSGTTPSWAKPQNAVADASEARLHLVGDTERSRRARLRVGGAQVAGRHGEDAVAREDVVADQQGGSMALAPEPCECVVDLAWHARCGVGCGERRAPADSGHPRLECSGPSSSGDNAAVAAVVP